MAGGLDLNDLVYVTEELTSGDTKIWSLTLGQDSPSLISASRSRNPLPRVSPDGRWMAYSGPGPSYRTIFVVGYPEARRQWELAHGRPGFWSADGDMYFYTDLRGVLMSTAVRKSGNSFEWGAPTALFQPSGEIIGLYGERFLAVESETSDSAADSSFEVILNWEALVDQR